MNPGWLERNALNDEVKRGSEMYNTWNCWSATAGALGALFLRAC